MYLFSNNFEFEAQCVKRAFLLGCISVHGCLEVFLVDGSLRHHDRVKILIPYAACQDRQQIQHADYTQTSEHYAQRIRTG